MNLSIRARLRGMTIVLALAVLATTGVSVWGVLRLADRVDAAAAEHNRLRAVHELSLIVIQAREAARPNPATPVPARPAYLYRVRIGVERWAELLSSDAQAAMQSLLAELDAAHEAELAGDDAATWRGFGAFNKALNDLAHETVGARNAIEQLETETQVEAKWIGATAIAASVGALLLVVLVVMSVARSMLRPIDALVAGVRRVGRGRFDQRVEAQGAPELAAVAEQFNDMAARLEALYTDMASQVRQRGEALARAERLASVGYLAAGVAHEINNPLAVITTEAELALRQEGVSSQTQEALEVVIEEAYRCKSITEQLLGLTRPAGAQIDDVKLDDLLKQVCDHARLLDQARGRTLSAEGNGSVVATQRSLLKQVLLNLAVNALEATTEGRGRVSLSAERDPQRAGVRIIVSDNGVGLEPEMLQRVFEPFFTMRRGRDSATHPRVGTGLGLTISHAIIAGLGGRLQVESDGAGKGSRFVIEMPEAAVPSGVRKPQLNGELDRD